MNWSYWSLAFATLAMFSSLADIAQSRGWNAEAPDYLDDTLSEDTLDQMRGLGASSWRKNQNQSNLAVWLLPN